MTTQTSVDDGIIYRAFWITRRGKPESTGVVIDVERTKYATQCALARVGRARPGRVSFLPPLHLVHHCQCALLDDRLSTNDRTRNTLTW